MTSPRVNTLFNYFQRSVSESPKTPKSEPRKQNISSGSRFGNESVTPKSEPRKQNISSGSRFGNESVTPKSEPRKQNIFSGSRFGDESVTPKSEKRRLNDFSVHCMGDVSETPKRKRIKVLTSSSEDENDENLKENSENKIISTPKIKSKLNKSPKKIMESKIGEINDSFVFKHTSLSFLLPSEIKDKSGKRISDPGYDSTTLYVPSLFLLKQTPCQKQWWTIKSSHFDKILFFKMGKFYEVFHMDALLVVQYCDIQLMKKEIAHAGFPEIAITRFSNILIQKGYKIVRIEQTETPEMLEKRCKISKCEKVVNRELCQISSIGTQISEFPTSTSNYQYLLALDFDDNNNVGICYVDTTIGSFKIGHYVENGDLSITQLTICHLDPVEILFDFSKNNSIFQKLLKSKFPTIRLQNLPCQTHNQIIENLQVYFDTLPQVLKASMDHLGFVAFGSILHYLKESMIDHNLMSRGKFDVFLHLSENDDAKKYLTLDDNTIYNLDVLSRNPKFPSLFKTLNFTCTPFGKRTLKKWICSPLFLVEDILERQKALSELNSLDLTTIKKSLQKLPDLERLVGIVASNSTVPPVSHPENRAVYFDSGVYSKRKNKNFVSCIRGFEIAITVKEKLVEENLKSCLLKNLIENEFPDLSEVVAYYQKAFDTNKAMETGRIIPASGVDEDYDRVIKEDKELELEAAEYLKAQKAYFESSDIKYVGTSKNAFQLEISESALRKPPSSQYILSSQRKGYKRYTTSQTREFVDRKISNNTLESKVLNSVAVRLFSQFSKHSNLWNKAINSLSTFDCLVSLCEYSFKSISGVFPQVISPTRENTVLCYQDGLHPILSIGGNFIPNDLNLSPEKPMMILTGANMGGKSTLMRQTALLTILGQLGCQVPASSMKFTPVDRIFTRIGASDNIFGGESTFMVELSESAKIMKYASKDSLVIIDELGRGTTTYDGMAIAAAVAQKMTSISCRTFFSTHFHQLASEYNKDSPGVSVYHMAYLEDGSRDITFLYKLKEGSCPKSHGFNTARLAGVPSDVIELGIQFAAEYERKEKLRYQTVNLLEILNN